METPKQDKPEKDFPKTAKQDNKPKDNFLEQGDAASMKLRKKKNTVTEVHVDHINIGIC